MLYIKLGGLLAAAMIVFWIVIRMRNRSTAAPRTVIIVSPTAGPSEDYFDTHVPRCISEFVAKRMPLPEAVLDGHGELLNPIFQLNCPCGQNRGHVIAWMWESPTHAGSRYALSPLVHVCHACEAQRVFFDSAIHGYDAVLNNMTQTIRAEGTQAPVSCSKCDRAEYEVFVRFEMTGDLWDQELGLPNGEEHNYFSWFSCHGRCASCGVVFTIADLECA